MFQQKAEIKVNDIKELFYIVAIDNLDSILKNGILSHKRANRLGEHIDISNSEVQDRREKKIQRAKEGKKSLRLHQHVNFYIQPFNAMMYQKGNLDESVCVIRVRKEIFARGDGILSDRNAATDSVRFFKTNDWKMTGMASEAISAPYLKGMHSPHYISREEFEERKQLRQSEALFPYKIKPEFIAGIFVYNQAAKSLVEAITVNNQREDIVIVEHPSLFMSNPDSYTFKIEKFLPTPELSKEEREQLSYSSPSSSDSEQSEEDDTETFSY